MRFLILATLLLAGPAAAQTPAQAPATPASAATRAMAAGYKALTVCSALKTAEFVGGSRTLESIEANELTGIYPELDPLIRDLPVERFPARVAVAWDEDMPPRSATWTPRDGCQIMPVGWTGEQVALRTIPPRRDPGFAPGQASDPAAMAAVLERASSGGYGAEDRKSVV